VAQDFIAVEVVVVAQITIMAHQAEHQISILEVQATQDKAITAVEAEAVRAI
jgi:hypothetical protein